MGDRPSDDYLDEAREQGRADALSAAEHGPDEPLAHIAWAIGFGEPNLVQEAVQRARAAGATWAEVGRATGDHPKTAQTKYGGGYRAQRRYRERKRGQ